MAKGQWAGWDLFEDGVSHSHQRASGWWWWCWGLGWDGREEQALEPLCPSGAMKYLGGIVDLDSNPRPVPSCVILGGLLNLSAPRFPHLYNEDDHISLLGFC